MLLLAWSYAAFHGCAPAAIFAFTNDRDALLSSAPGWTKVVEAGCGCSLERGLQLRVRR